MADLEREDSVGQELALVSERAECPLLVLDGHDGTDHAMQNN